MSGDDTGEDRTVLISDYTRHWLTMAKHTAAYPDQDDPDDSDTIAAAALVAIRHPGELLDIMAAIQTARAQGFPLPDWQANDGGGRHA